MEVDKDVLNVNPELYCNASMKVRAAQVTYAFDQHGRENREL